MAIFDGISVELDHLSQIEFNRRKNIEQDKRIASNAFNIQELMNTEPEVYTVNNVLPDENNNITITADDISDEETTNKFITAEKLAQIATNTNNINALETNKADKATTLSGYGITDAYTKTEIESKIASVYKYKGSVANYASLPTTDLTIGDVYNVEDTGDNYAWTGTEWDKLAGTIDLSNYATKTELNTQSFSKVYKALTELTGITTSSTLAQVCDAMVDNSYLNASTSGYEGLVPTGETDLNGQLEIIKVNANRVRLAWSYQNASRQPIYFATYRNVGGFLGWKRFLTDSEAQNLYATKLSIGQWHVPYRDLSGTGEPNTSKLATMTSPLPEALLIRDNEGKATFVGGTSANQGIVKSQLDSALANRVTTNTEQTISGEKTFTSNIIGNLTGNSSSSTYCSRLKGVDTRDDNQPPEWYYINQVINARTFLSEFKTSSAIGLSSSLYCLLLTSVPWSDPTGGLPSQTAYMSNGDIFKRAATNATTWGAWNKLATTNDIDSAIQNAIYNSWGGSY